MRFPVARGLLCDGRAPRRMAGLRWDALCALGAMIACTATAAAADISVTDAWVTPSEATGTDVVLSMTVKNDGAAADTLLRAHCPFAGFVEKHTIDHGEGAPSMRPVKDIPVPAHSTLKMSSSGYHLMLLQTSEKLSEGGKFACSVTFRSAGPMDIEVKVAKTAPAS